MAGILEERLSGKAPAPKKEPSKEKRPDNGSKAAERFFQGEEPQEEEKDDIPVTAEDLEEMEGLDALMSEDVYEKDQKRSKKSRRVFQAVMSLACVYMVMLIYGTAITEYRYDENGEVTPVVLSVEEIGARNEYSSMLAMYLQARSLYETILTLDYRMAAGVEDTMGVAPEYEAALDTVSTLAVQIEASNISSRYNQVRNMLLTWVKTHVAAYCQYMSAAVTENDADAAAEAIAARQVVNDYFQTITMNIVTMGEDLEWYALDDIKDWSPDSFVKSEIEGIS